MKLSSKIYIFVICISVAVAIFSVGATFYFTRDLLIDEKYASYSDIAELTGKRIDSFLADRFLTTEILAERKAVGDALLRGSSVDIGLLKQGIYANKLIDSAILEIYIIDKKGKIVATTAENDVREEFSDSPDHAVVLERLVSGAPAYSDVFLDPILGVATMIFAAPVVDGNSGYLGAVLEYVDWQLVLEILADTNADFVHLLNKDGVEIGSNIPEYNRDILEEDYSTMEDFKDIFYTHSEGQRESVILNKDLHGNFESLMAHYHLSGHGEYKGNGWLLIAEQPASRIFSAINYSASNVAVVIFSIILLASGVFLYFIRKSVIDPIVQFSEIATRITAGEKNLRVPDFGNDELGFTARAFNTMVSGFYDLTRNLENKVREKTIQLEEELEFKEAQAGILEKSKAATTNLLEDISAEKARIEALALELSKFELAVENAYEHMIITDPDGVIVFANKAAERITGYKRGEIIGKTPALWGGQMPKEFYEDMWKTIKTDKKVFLGQMKNKRKTGEIYDVDVQISPIVGKDGILKFFVGIERDITDAKRLEEARSNFISVASHQLRTPLTSIKWISELLLSGDVGEVSEKQKEFIDDLYISSNRMITLVNSLLNIARIESTELRVKSESVNLAVIYEAIIKELGVLIREKKQSVNLVTADDLADIHTDSKLLYEILKNLISNSVKYTNNGGTITVSAEKKNDEFIISVKDNGIGIPAAQQDKVYNKFFRGDNAVKINTDGTGLGMYIVKNLIDLLNGKVWFESVENKGTTFYISLPAIGPHVREGSKTLISTN